MKTKNQLRTDFTQEALSSLQTRIRLTEPSVNTAIIFLIVLILGV